MGPSVGKDRPAMSLAFPVRLALSGAIRGLLTHRARGIVLHLALRELWPVLPSMTCYTAPTASSRRHV